jgi:hypothetical protein
MSNDDEYIKYQNIQLQHLDGLTYEDLFEYGDEEEQEEEKVIYPNPQCHECQVEMFTLVDTDIPKISICHKCNNMIKHN